MAYVKADDVLPPDLLRALQEHVQGCLVYVPRAGKSRLEWGTRTGARKWLDARNAALLEARRGGASLGELAERFSLGEDAVRKVLYGRGKAS